MKKLFIVLFAVLMACSLYAADSFKFKVEGPESSYNQLRITNRTNYENFDVKAFILKNEDDEITSGKNAGTFHLLGKEDTDSCSGKYKRKQYIGVIIPKEFEDVKFSVNYYDYPFFDIVEVVLTDSSYTTVDE